VYDPGLDTGCGDSGGVVEARGPHWVVFDPLGGAEVRALAEMGAGWPFARDQLRLERAGLAVLQGAEVADDVSAGTISERLKRVRQVEADSRKDAVVEGSDAGNQGHLTHAPAEDVDAYPKYKGEYSQAAHE